MRDEQVIHGLRKLVRTMHAHMLRGCGDYDPVDFEGCCRCAMADHEALSCKVMEEIRKGIIELSVY